MFKKTLGATSVVLATVLFGCSVAQAKSLSNNEDAPVIPSPNQDFGDSNQFEDIKRVGIVAPTNLASSYAPEVEQQAASNEAIVPVYVSPYVRSERAVTPFVVAPAAASPINKPVAASARNFDDHQESSHAPLNYAPRPSASMSSVASSSPRDLKTSASYGHHHHGGHYGGGHDSHGWLDMGAWTGGKGSFGWYADYPVGGGKHHYGYGRR